MLGCHVIYIGFVTKRNVDNYISDIKGLKIQYNVIIIY